MNERSELITKAAEMFEKTAPAKLLPFLMVLNSHPLCTNNNYIVGGAVRDLLLGNVPKDYDIVTDIPMDKLVEVFEDGGFRVKKTGVAHFVLNVIFNGYEVEISNFRKDVVCNGRQAEVEIGTMKDDAFRRDFTINSLYMNIQSGEVLDPTNAGLRDIENRILRFVGKPTQRIREDFLRVFRFYRFVGKGFVPDKSSLKAVRELWNEAYKNTTPERARVEMEKIVL